MILSQQIRAARALLRITVVDLANASGVGISTIKRIEAVNGIPPAHARTLDQISRALSAAGIEFVGTPDDRPGVRIK